MLEQVEKRKIFFVDKGKDPVRTFMVEKEREFLDCVRLIIQNGYVLSQPDVLDILRFI